MKKENSCKMIWIGIALGVITALVGVIVWLTKKGCKDIEEHYEYFDDDESDATDDYEEFDEEDYDEDEEVGYVKIKDFMNYAEDESVEVKQSAAVKEASENKKMNENKEDDEDQDVVRF